MSARNASPIAVTGVVAVLLIVLLNSLRAGTIQVRSATVLLIVLVLLLIGALPAWPYSTGWGYYPSGGLGLILLILIILAVMGRI